MASALDTAPKYRAKFRARLLSSKRKGYEALRAARAGEAGVQGEATILVAVYDVPDTEVAYGNSKRQVIDQGAFRSWIDSHDWAVGVKGFIDHGDAPLTGFVTMEKFIGRAVGAEEQRSGLALDTRYNLDTQVGYEAYSNLLFDELGTRFSFGWRDEVLEDGDDGMEHVVEFPEGLTEWSQVAFAAQAMTGVISARMKSDPEFKREVEKITLSSKARGPIRAHSTDTSDDTYDGGENEKNLPAEDADQSYRAMYAWFDSEADDANEDGYPDAKSAYKFPHHIVDGDGNVGAAATAACSNIIAVLNGGRGGADIPDDDRQGVYDHAAKHLKDAGRDDADIPELRAVDDGEQQTGESGDNAPDPARAPSATSAGVSLDTLPMALREAWDEYRGGEEWSWVEEAFADDPADPKSGKVIVSYFLEQSRHTMVPWELNDDGEVEFNYDTSQEVRRDWIVDGKTLRGFVTSEMAMRLVGSLIRDGALDRTELDGAINGADRRGAVASFYQHVLDARAG